MEQLKMIESSKEEATNFAAFIGIDWADQRHAWAMQTPDGTLLQGELEHTPEAVEAWAMELERRFSGQSLAVALEQSRGSLVFMLSKYAHLVLFPVHPTMLVKYREGFRPSGAKSDPSDAAFLVELLVHHRDKLWRLNPDTVETRTLQFLVEGRRKFVNEKTRYSNRLTDCLKMYYPQVLHWFCEVSSEIAGEFLQRWPTLEKLQKERPETLRKFFVQYHSAQSDRVDRRLEEIRQAIPATTDAAVLTACVSNTAALVRILRDLRATIQDYDKQIETLARQHPEFALFDSFPGAGAALVPRLIAALGTQRERYHNAGEVQCYSGLRRWWPAAASSAGCIGAGLAPNLCGRRSMSGQGIPSVFAPGRSSITSSSVPRENRPTRPSGLSLSNGFAFCFVAGRIASLIERSCIQSRSHVTPSSPR